MASIPNTDCNMFEESLGMQKKNTAAQIVLGIFFTFVPLFVISGATQNESQDKVDNRMD